MALGHEGDNIPAALRQGADCLEEAIAGRIWCHDGIPVLACTFIPTKVPEAARGFLKKCSSWIC